MPAAKRLNVNLRVKIVDKLISNKFDPIAEKIRKQEVDFAIEIYNTKYSDKDRKLMASLPEGWLPICNGVCAASQGNMRHNFELDKEYLIPASDDQGYSYPTLVNLSDHPDLEQRIFSYKTFIQENQDQKATVTKQIWAVLNPIKTIPELLKTWPEVASIVEECEAGATVPENLPAVLLSPLNEALGLNR